MLILASSVEPPVYGVIQAHCRDQGSDALGRARLRQGEKSWRQRQGKAPNLDASIKNLMIIISIETEACLTYGGLCIYYTSPGGIVHYVAINKIFGRFCH